MLLFILTMLSFLNALLPSSGDLKLFLLLGDLSSVESYLTKFLSVWDRVSCGATEVLKNEEA